MAEFQVVSEYSPAGDQPQAIDALARGVELGLSEQTLLGVTGSGKTYTMAKVIERVQRPTLVLAHNKTLAAQLCSEFKEFFPHNAVEYFVSSADEFIVDCKSMDAAIYRRYTGGDVRRMRRNLEALLRAVGPERVLVRVPRIPAFSTAEDQARSAEALRAMGVTR